MQYSICAFSLGLRSQSYAYVSGLHELHLVTLGVCEEKPKYITDSMLLRCNDADHLIIIVQYVTPVVIYAVPMMDGEAAAL
jgi:hypothetical protein